MIARALLLVAGLLVPFLSLHAAGFTEPPITFYGQVNQKADGYSLLLTTGQLVFTIQPASGAAFTVTASLSALTGGYSYQLLIPVEKVPSGFTLSPGSIADSNSAVSYNRGSITLDGFPVTISSPALPGGATFTFAENQRGKFEHVDLQIAAPFADSDGDGTPDWWEMKYGFDPFDPTDGSVDTDGDGKTNLQEYLSGTDPLNPNDNLRITKVIKPTGLDITWTSVPGRNYQVYEANPLTGVFNPLSGIITAGPGETTKTYTATINGTRHFYKVVVVP